MGKRKVLFLCTGNSCRSQLAEALVNARLGESWEAFSAGTRPVGFVQPYAIQVLNTILGGSFTSRLNTNLRETHGYAYGAGSSFDMRLGAGPFMAASRHPSGSTSSVTGRPSASDRSFKALKTPIDASR